MAKTTKKTAAVTPVQEVTNAQVKSKESAKDVTIRVIRVLIATDIAFAIVLISVTTLPLEVKLMLLPAGLHALWLVIKR